MEELVKKLRYESTWRDDYPEDKDMLLQAANAIEQLDKDLERAKEWASFWEKEANEALKKFQVAVASKPSWIPVTERLPKYGDWVLGIGPQKGYYVCEYRGITHFPYSGDSPWFSAKGRSVNITHWMPLPEPPKEEAE